MQLRELPNGGDLNRCHEPFDSKVRHLLTKPPSPIDYAPPRPEQPAAGSRYLLVIAGCFAVGWLIWLGIGYVSYDLFDDELLPWLAVVALMFGTPCGAILSVIAVAILKLQSRGNVPK